MDKNTEVFFEEISSFVQENNLTHQQIAKMISKENGISISTISKYLAGGIITSQNKTFINQWYLKNSKNPASLSASLSTIKATQIEKQSIIENYFSKIIDPKEENEMIDKLTLVIETKRIDIWDLIKMNCLKKIQIAEMSGVHATEICSFLNGQCVSFNVKTKISKWYLRYSKHPQIFQQTYFPSINTCKQTTLDKYIVNNNLVSINNTKEVDRDVVEDRVSHSQTESSNFDSNVLEKKLSKSGSSSNSLLGILFFKLSIINHFKYSLFFKALIYFQTVKIRSLILSVLVKQKIFLTKSYLVHLIVQVQGKMRKSRKS